MPQQDNKPSSQNCLYKISIQNEDFDHAAEYALAEQAAPHCGAIVSFIGKVRGNDEATKLKHLWLEHMPGVTEVEIQKIIQQAAQRWSIPYVRVIHRIGPLPVSAQIVMVLTASAHRLAAYEANHFIMDYLKTEAPFWKKSYYVDGQAQWVQMKSSDLDRKNTWLSE